MKDRNFLKVLLIVTVLCVILTVAHAVYAVDAYDRSSIIEFIAREPW